MNEEMQFDFRKFQLPNISLRTIGWIVIGVILLIFLVSSVFTVNPEETGVIQRFGKYTRVVSPGLNFKIPFGVETVKKVPVERQLKEEFGFRSQTAGVRTEYAGRGFQNH
jgi:membrane protease subunit HflK